MIWFAIIYMVATLLFISAAATLSLPAICFHVWAILFIGCTAVLILWAAYKDFKDADPVRKVCFILFGLVIAGSLLLAHYYPAIAQTIFN